MTPPLLGPDGKPAPSRAEARADSSYCAACGAKGSFEEVKGFGGVNTRYCLKCGEENR